MTQKLSNGVEYEIFGEGLIDGETKNQFYTALKAPGVVKGALMADGHYGYSLPIGGVVLVKNRVYPKWVGYDQGCGVCAVKTNFKMDDVIAKADEIRENIESDVPAGFKRFTGTHRNGIGLRAGLKSAFLSDLHVLADEQLGTLGGGNHFIEVCFDIHDDVFFVIHSGSRGVGYKCAEHWMQEAEIYGDSFVANSLQGKAFLQDLDITTKFALDNREFMLTAIEQAVRRAGVCGSILWTTLINKVHNSVDYDAIFGGYVHRKGATSALPGEMGVIPGNMSTGSIIVEGLGFMNALCSAPHGAGRVSSRKVARTNCDMAFFERTMTGISHGPLTRVRDENPAAYKEPNEVLYASLESVEEVTRLWPILNVKG